MRRLRIATRTSPLALAQAELVAEELRRALGAATELLALKTRGDRILGQPLATIGGKGLFVKEIEEALLDGRADLAVHSAKDLPAELAPGLELAAFPLRADPRDALVGRTPGTSLAGLPRAARVGTGSLRRKSQLLALRPDLVVCPLRGNVQTRLAKLETEDPAAVVLACAGLERLGLAERVHERLDPAQLLPAGGQGVLAIETREGDPVSRELAVLDHAATRAAVRAERAFLARLGGDCSTPVAAYAEPLDGERVRLRGLVASEDGRRVARAEAEAPHATSEEAGRRAAEQVLASGGDVILAGLHAAAGRSR